MAKGSGKRESEKQIMHRIFCADIPAEGASFKPDPREAEHLFKVFRAAPDDPVEVLDGTGRIARAHILPGKMVQIDSLRTVPPPTEKLHLCCALPRRQKMDQLLKQAAELGAWSIRPLRCERSVAEGGPRERWDLLLQEACKQSGNPFLPQLLPEISLPELLKDLQQKEILAYFGSVAPAPAEFGCFRQREKAILIGPEGGFSPAETEEMQRAGVRPLNLGPHILRLETAAVTGLAVLRLLLLLLTGVLLFPLLPGCSGENISRNPLLLKGEKLRRSGDPEAARRYLRQAVARYPEHPEPYFLLGKLCSEDLGDPWEAIFCYRSFLQFSPAGDPRRAMVEKWIAAAQQELISDALRRENAKKETAFQTLREENQELMRRNMILQKEAVRLNTLLLQQNRNLKATKQQENRNRR